MKATAFEYRHQTGLHLLVAGAAVLTYLLNPDDIVWAMVRHHPNSQLLERSVFGCGTILLLVSAFLETCSEALLRFPESNSQLLRSSILASRLLLALALGLLLPLPGTVLLLASETFLVIRLLARDHDVALSQQPNMLSGTRRDAWFFGFKTALSKWGLLLSMCLFTFTLRDRIAEIGAAVSFVVWLALNRRRLVDEGA